MPFKSNLIFDSRLQSHERNKKKNDEEKKSYSIIALVDTHVGHIVIESQLVSRSKYKNIESNFFGYINSLRSKRCSFGKDEEKPFASIFPVHLHEKLIKRLYFMQNAFFQLFALIILYYQWLWAPSNSSPYLIKNDDIKNPLNFQVISVGWYTFCRPVKCLWQWNLILIHNAYEFIRKTERKNDKDREILISFALMSCHLAMAHFLKKKKKVDINNANTMNKLRYTNSINLHFAVFEKLFFDSLAYSYSFSLGSSSAIHST